jgi:hypothetical protein
LDLREIRKTNTTSMIPFMESFTNVLSDQAMHAVEWMDPIVYKLLQHILGSNFCLIKIVTQGLPEKAFSFENSPHVDRDTPTEATSDKLRTCASSREEFRECGYLIQWFLLKGAPSVPTSCCWTLIGHSATLRSVIEVFAYFVFETLAWGNGKANG